MAVITRRQLEEGFEKHFGVNHTIFESTFESFKRALGDEPELRLAIALGRVLGKTEDEVMADLCGDYHFDVKGFFETMGHGYDFIEGKSTEEVDEFLREQYGDEALAFIRSLLTVSGNTFDMREEN